MSRDDRVDVFDRRDRFGERLRMGHGAAAVRHVDVWQGLPGEHVAGVHCAQRREHDEGVAVGMTGPEVIEVYFILAFAQGELVLVRALWQEPGLVPFELVHLRHVCLCIFLNDAVDRRAKEPIAAGVISMRVRVDDGRHGFVGHGLDPVENGLTPSGQLRIDDNDASVRDEHGGIASAERVDVGHARARDDIEIVFYLLNFGG